MLPSIKQMQQLEGYQADTTHSLKLGDKVQVKIGALYAGLWGHIICTEMRKEGVFHRIMAAGPPRCAGSTYTIIAEDLEPQKPPVAPPVKPRRRFEMSITIGADTWNDLLERLADVNDQIPCEEPKFDGPEQVTFEHCTLLLLNSMVANPNASHKLVCEFLPDMSHELYIDQLRKYIDSISVANTPEVVQPLAEDARREVEQSEPEKLPPYGTENVT